MMAVQQRSQRGNRVNRDQQVSLMRFAGGMIGLGILALIYGDFALSWQPVAAWVPGRTALAYGSGLLMLLAGTGLLFKRLVKLSIYVLFPYLIVWFLLKVPALFAAPRMEAVWFGIGEIGVLLAGGWTLFAVLADAGEGSILRFITGQRGLRIARILFAVSLLPIGLFHIVYIKQTLALVPAWLPYRMGWAYLTGVGQIACGLGVLFSILPRVAAMAEANMIGVFALLVWFPYILAAPKTRLPWTAFLITWAIASAAWVVAEHIAPKRGVQV
jgi:uncharacterized membrane protein